MRRAPVASRLSRFIHIGFGVVAIGCSDTTEPSSPARLVFSTEPTTVVAGYAIFPTVVVLLQDEAGNPFAGADRPVTLAIIGTTGAVLEGAATVTAANGTARFPNLRTTTAGTGYTLRATSPGLPELLSAPFNVLAGPAAKIGFVVQPVTTLGRVAMSPVHVAFQDWYGNTAPGTSGSISLILESTTPGARLSGPTTVDAVNGVSVFTGLTIDGVGNGYKLVASSNPGLGSVSSALFSVTSGAAARLVFGVEPWNAKPNEPVNPAVTISVEDAQGNLVTSATNSITIAIGQNPVGGTLSGNVATTPANGVAVFANLRFDKLGSGYTITASSSGLSTVETAPFAVRNPLTFTAVSSGYFHSCGIATDNVSYCWGSGDNGELGNPRLTSSNAPVPVFGGHTFTRISAGRSHSCALTAGGVAYCWGGNFAGQLGNGTTVLSSIPSPVSGGLVFAEVTAGYGHSCGVTTGGAGYCWGGNSVGELGNGATGISLTPVAVASGLTFASISPGRGFTCGRTTGGGAYCWGENGSGELGDGTTGARTVPTPVQGGLTFASVSAGGFHACGITTDGTARCWGQNNVGQLGDGTTVSRTIPGTVSGGLTFTSLSSGNRHTCGITTAGGSYCWGENLGYLGDGTNTNRSSPVAVTGGLSFAALSAGRFHSCGVTVANEAHCWGDNSSGRMGIGPALGSLIPVRVR